MHIKETKNVDWKRLLSRCHVLFDSTSNDCICDYLNQFYISGVRSDGYNKDFLNALFEIVFELSEENDIHCFSNGLHEAYHEYVCERIKGKGNQ